MNTARGFTLIELLVVIAIIGMLSSVVLGSLSGARTKAADSKRLSDLNAIRTALELYASSNNGRYPNTASSWVSSYNGTAGDWIPGLAPTYIAKIPMDTKNNPGTPELLYYYNSDGVSYCMQFSQENSCASNPYFWGVWNNTCKLRIGDLTWCQTH